MSVPINDVGEQRGRDRQATKVGIRAGSGGRGELYERGKNENAKELRYAGEGYDGWWEIVEHAVIGNGFGGDKRLRGNGEVFNGKRMR